MEIDPHSQPFRDNYKLLIGSVVPRPIAFVSSQNADGRLNLAPFSFFNAVCPNPPTIMFAPVNRSADGTRKDTLLNILETEEFVVNIVTEDIAENMNIAATEYPKQYNEFEEAGLTPAPSVKITPPRVKESPINFECKLTKHVSIGEDGTPGSGNVIIGEVVYFHVADDLYHEGRIDLEKLKPIARLAGDDYCRVTDLFAMPRIPYETK
ncbi:MAG: hypothetical protein MAGBODY4_01458 [Candidatus Marinimicrobia bacterium]|nr:hypothetical protein [Candidatus Neomarinimicrobiota bacterium]